MNKNDGFPWQLHEIVNLELPCMSLTAAFVKVADAKQYLAFGKDAANHSHSSGLSRYNILSWNFMQIMTKNFAGSPVRKEPSPTLLRVTIYHLSNVKCKPAISNQETYLSLVHTNDADRQAPQQLLNTFIRHPSDCGRDDNWLLSHGSRNDVFLACFVQREIWDAPSGANFPALLFDWDERCNEKRNFPWGNINWTWQVHIN